MAAYKIISPKLNDMNYHRMRYQKAPYNFNAVTGTYSLRPVAAV